MQDPNEDTEWNDILRQKGILPPKQELEVTQDQIEELLDEVRISNPVCCTCALWYCVLHSALRNERRP